jgi:hypothetical protein
MTVPFRGVSGRTCESMSLLRQWQHRQAPDNRAEGSRHLVPREAGRQAVRGFRRNPLSTIAAPAGPEICPSPKMNMTKSMAVLVRV